MLDEQFCDGFRGSGTERALLMLGRRVSTGMLLDVTAEHPLPLRPGEMLARPSQVSSVS